MLTEMLVEMLARFAPTLIYIHIVSKIKLCTINNFLYQAYEDESPTSGPFLLQDIEVCELNDLIAYDY